MHIARLFLLFSAGLIAATPLHAQAPAPSSAPEEKTAKPTPAPEPRISFDYIHVDGPYIAMTFDDGPSEKLTPKLLDLLAARHIKVTFFLIGENANEFPEIVKRAAREGHEIGNHSWSHPNLQKMSDEAVRSQLRRTDDAIKAALGVSPTLMRPPYGSFSVRQKRWVKKEFGYDTILWDVDPLDWKRPGPAAVCSRIVRNTRAGSIILSHDIHPGTIEAMPATFDQLEAKGYKFVTVSELIKMATPEPTPTPRPKPGPKHSPEAKPGPQTGTSPKPSPPVQRALPVSSPVATTSPAG